MSAIDLNKLFPLGDDGSQGPLPKQQEFLNHVLNPKGPQNVAYFGGFGSGKSMILCIANILQGVIHGGEYVICREFMPELRSTTMKLFHELLPPELIIEKKEAVAETVIKSVNGTARFYFRGLDEPGKLDSLTLDGASIDEASQVSEEAFLKLQGRLRGRKGLRKMLLVGNPKGHDYVYRYFISKKDFQDFHHPTLKRVVTADEQKAQYHMISAPSTENKHLTPDYLQKMFSTYSPERLKRDVYGSFDSFEGQVYHEFNRADHVVRPFKIPANWKRHIRIDHGFRNPAAVLFFAISPDGEVYVYKEWYKTEHLISEIIKGDKKKSPHKIGFIEGLGKTDKFETAKIDPSVNKRSGKDGTTDYQEYLRHWPSQLPPLQLARNPVSTGIDRVKQYLKVHPRLGKPSLYIFDTCVNLLEEISTYRYPDLLPNQEGKKAEHENPLKVNDHALDALRYMILDLPEPYSEEPSEDERRKKFSNVEIRFQDELKESRTGKGTGGDPFQDNI